MVFSFCFRALAATSVLVAVPAAAATPRETLLAAAFGPSDKAHAIEMVEGARTAASAQLARNPRNRQAAFDQAMATGYRAKLKRGAADAKQAKQQFEALVAAEPRNPEPLLALAGWHLESVHSLGGFLAGTALGAKKATGLAALDRAVALGGGSPTVSSFAAMLRIMTNPTDVSVSRGYAEAAFAAPAVTPADAVMKRAAGRLLVPLRAGDGKAAALLAGKLMPFGRFG